VIARIEPATERLFAEVATWRYDPPYDFYDGDEEPVLNPERFFQVLDADGEVIGFLYFERRENTLEYGLGLRPDLTGRGFGLEFFRAGLEFGRDLYRPSRVITNVAEFNDRARKVYERAGFRVTGRREKRGVTFLDLEEMQ
jgi:aminoglycoside 6'-N-acetyltransferase/ribosomal-protein-alanine N-acetyltransferase